MWMWQFDQKRQYRLLSVEMMRSLNSRLALQAYIYINHFGM